MKKIIFLGGLFIQTLLASIFAKDKQKHYWAGLGREISIYSLTRIMTWNKFSNQSLPYAENKRRAISLLSGMGAIILIGASKELIWDWALDKGYPEYEDFVATLIGGNTGSIITYILDCTFIKRKEKQNIYLNYLYILPTKNSLKFYCQIKF